MSKICQYPDILTNTGSRTILDVANSIESLSPVNYKSNNPAEGLEQNIIRKSPRIMGFFNQNNTKIPSLTVYSKNLTNNN